MRALDATLKQGRAKVGLGHGGGAGVVAWLAAGGKRSSMGYQRVQVARTAGAGRHSCGVVELRHRQERLCGMEQTVAGRLEKARCGVVACGHGWHGHDDAGRSGDVGMMLDAG